MKNKRQKIQPSKPFKVSEDAILLVAKSLGNENAYLSSAIAPKESKIAFPYQVVLHLNGNPFLQGTGSSFATARENLMRNFYFIIRDTAKLFVHLDKNQYNFSML